MLSFLIRRLLSGVVLLFALTSVAFFLLYSSSTGIARRLLGDFATEEQVAAKVADLGLDQPVGERYLTWLGAAVQGDLGDSWFRPESVSQAMANRLPVTLSVVVVAVVLTALLSVLLGTLAAVRGGALDRIVQVLSVLGHAIPSFIIAVFLVSILAVQLKILPATGFVSLTQSPAGWARAIALPVTSLVIGTTAASAQQIRGAMIDILQRDFVRTLRSRGLSEVEVILRHVLRSAAPAGLTILSLQFVSLLGGNVVVESIFALPGIGSLAVEATSNGDIPIVMAVVVFMVVVVIVVNLGVDILNGWLNSRARVA